MVRGKPLVAKLSGLSPIPETHRVGGEKAHIHDGFRSPITLVPEDLMPSSELHRQ